MDEEIPEENIEENPEGITFDWVRHAESVANWANNKPSDNYTKKELHEELKLELQKFLALEYKNVNTMKKSDEFPLVKQVYEIIDNALKNESKDETLKNKCKTKDYEEVLKLTPDDIINPTDETKKILNDIWEFGKTDIVNNDCIVSLKDTLYNKDNDKEKKKNINYKEIKKRDYAYWLKNMITTNFLFQPTLTNIGRQQAENLGKNFLSIEEESVHDLVISSPSVRTLMTAYIALIHSNQVTEKQIIIVPYTNEKENDTQFVLNEVSFHDFCNAAIHPNDIERVCLKIKEFLYLTYSSDKKITFDSTYYIEFCKNKPEKEIDKIRRCNIDNFWNYVKNDGNEIFQNKKKILSFCHGYAITEVRKTSDIDVDKLYNKKKYNEIQFETWGINTSVFRHNYTDGKAVKLQTAEGIDKVEDSDAMKPEILKKLGLVFYPKKIRNDEFLDADKTKLPENDAYMGLHEGSLRYEIAKITHGTEYEIYCQRNGYWHSNKETNWKNFKTDADKLLLLGLSREDISQCHTSNQSGGRKTRRGKKMRTHTKRIHKRVSRKTRVRKNKKGRKTRKGRARRN
jgi:hypothetical protein